jgi:epoxyqueuosine reductase QueG
MDQQIINQSDFVDLTRRVKDYAIEKIGFDLVGVASAADPLFKAAPEGHGPTDWLPNARTVVVGGLKVLTEILDTTPSPIYSKHYDQMNAWLSQAGYSLCRFLQSLGFKALWTTETDPYEYYATQVIAGEPRYTPSFSHLHAAVAAGLGVKGKIGLVLTPQFGPRQRWISIITTAPLIADPPYSSELCFDRIKPGRCNRCIAICRKEQSGALKPWPEEGGVDMFVCTWAHLRNQGLACGLCIKVCPVGMAK